MHITHYWLKNNYIAPKVSHLLKDYKTFVFLSPHFDDAVLSCGLLIHSLQKAGKNLRVVTVFTKCTKSPPNPQAKLFLKQCAYSDGEKLFADRIKEDIQASKVLKYHPTHLKYVDAAWRLDNNSVPIYKSTKSQFSGNIAIQDKDLETKIEKSLKKLLSRANNCVILAPFGVGGHADHVIVKRVAEKLSIQIPVLFWSDFPYNLDSKKVPNLKADIVVYPKPAASKVKNNSILEYKTQIKAIFGNSSIPPVPEYYYLRHDKEK